jgi:hypothetical protein
MEKAVQRDRAGRVMPPVPDEHELRRHVEHPAGSMRELEATEPEEEAHYGTGEGAAERSIPTRPPEPFRPDEGTGAPYRPPS